MKKTNKLISILLAAAMLMSMVPLTVLAAEDDVPEGTVAAVLLPDGTTEYYTNLQTAINAAVASSEGATVKLIENITLDDGKYIDIYDADGLLILDLNGKVLTGNTGRISFTTGAGTLRVRYSDVKITDSGTGGAIINNNSEEFSTAVGNLAGSALEIEKGTVRGAYSGISPKAQEFSRIIVSGGSVEGKHYGIYTQQTNSLKVTGGSISSEQYAVCSLGKVEITNGTFTGNYALFDGYQNDVSISGGTFCGSISDSDNNLPAFLAEGCVFIQNGSELDSSGSDTLSASQSNPITVIRKYAASVTAFGAEPVYYDNFAEAVTAASASEGSTLKLLDDITLTGTQSVSSGKFTLDLNGKTLLNEMNRVLFINTYADVTIKDSGNSGTIKTSAANNEAIFNYGTLTVDSGIITGEYGINNEGKLTINGGTFDGSKYSVYIVSADFATIEGGTFIGTVWGFSGYTINGGDFTASYIGINCEGGVLTVNGGTFDIDEIKIYKGTVALRGGEFTNGFAVDDQNFDNNDVLTANAILADDYYYKNADGKVITVADNAASIGSYAKVSKDADLEDAVITLSQTEYEYSGSENKPAVTVTIGGKTLTENTDYTVAYADNINAGLAAVTVTAVADSDYSGEAVKEFNITPRAVTVSGVTIEGTKTYDGSTNAVITGGGTVENVIDGDNITVDATYAKATYADKNVGEDIAVAFSGFALTGEDAANYKLAAQPEAAVADITKKAVTATATAPDKAYDGNNDIDYSKIIITFDGILDGEEVGYTVKYAWYNGAGIGTDKIVPIVFNVTGDDAKNYSFPEGGEWLAPDYFVQATASIYNDFVPVQGTEYIVNSNDWINTDFVITANEGYQLSLTNTAAGEWTDTLSKSEETGSGNITFYVKNTQTGAISLAVTENYKIDKTAPTGEFGDSRGRYFYKLLGETQDKDYYENHDIFIHTWGTWDIDKNGHIRSGVKEKSYYFSDKELTQEELNAVAEWTEFELDIEIEDFSEFNGEVHYSYIKVTDNAGNVNYYYVKLISDQNGARINGVLDGFTYYTTQLFSVTDNYEVDDVLVNHERVTTGYDAIILKGNCDATYEIYAEDSAGNYPDEAIITMKPIATLSEPIDGITEENVTSSDKQTIEAVKAKVAAIDTTHATDDEKAELQAIIDRCDTLLDKLAEIQAEIDRINNAVDSYTEDTVKSYDTEVIEQLKEDIQALIDSGNVIVEEIKALEETKDKADALIDKIADTEEQLDKIGEIKNSYDPEKVTSDDKAAVEEIIAEIEAVNPDNLTDEQKKEYAEIKAELETLLDEIAAADKAVSDIGVEFEMYDENRVTIFWKDDIEALKAKIDALLADENMGEAEIAKLNEYKAQADNLIEIINDPCKYFSCRFFFFIWDCLTWKYNGILYIFSHLFGC